MTLGLGLALGLAVLIGLTLGALGAGGSIITLPVLVYVAGIPPQTAVGMSLVIVGGTSLLGSLLHYRRGYFHLQAAVLLGLTGMFTAYLGSALTHLVSSQTLLLLFSAVMLAVAGAMLRRPVETVQGAQCRPPRCLAIGAVVGALTGFLGVGGGFLIVPALVLFAGLDTRTAVGTSLAIIALNCTAGLTGQLRYSQFSWAWTIGFLLMSLAGMFGGTALAGRLPERSLRRAFAWFVILVAVAIGGANLRP